MNYTNIKTDDEVIYFRNEHDSSPLYKMTQEAFKAFTPNIDSADI